MIDLRRSTRLPLLLLLAAGLATGAACGGSGNGQDNGVASIKNVSDKSSGAGSDAKSKAGKDKKSPEDAMLDFARCMREHGVDMPDPDTSRGNGVVTFSAAAAAPGDGGGGPTLKLDDTFEKANEACKDLMGDVGPMNMTPEQQQEMQDQALAFSKCMREHGVNMPDPTFGEKGQVMMTIGDDNGIDPSDPKFADAQQACGSAFGPGGAKGGAGLSVSSGKIDGAIPKGAKGGMVMVGGGIPAAPAGGGSK